jgi:hypothetical protein
LSGWWFGTFFIFPYSGKNNPKWLIFFRGVGQPPTSCGLSLTESAGSREHGNGARNQTRPQIEWLLESNQAGMCIKLGGSSFQTKWLKLCKDVDLIEHVRENLSISLVPSASLYQNCPFLAVCQPFSDTPRPRLRVVPSSLQKAKMGIEPTNRFPQGGNISPVMG